MSVERKWTVQRIASPVIPIIGETIYRETLFLCLPETLTQVSHLYLRIESQQPLILSLKIVKGIQNLVHWTQKITYLNFIWGAMLALAIYHSCLFLALKDISILYFSLYILFSTVCHYSMNNPTIWGFIEIDNVTGYNRITIFLTAVSICWYTLFTRFFLRIGNFFPRIDKLLNVYFFANAFMAVMSIIVNPDLLNPVLYMFLFSSGFFFPMGYSVWKKGFRPAKYFMISTIFPCISVLYYTLFLKELLPYTTPLFFFMDVSFFMEGILLSLALANRIEILRAEREFAQGANHAKNRFLALMSHDIRTFMNAVLGMADQLWESPLNREQQKYVKIFDLCG